MQATLSIGVCEEGDVVESVVAVVAVRVTASNAIPAPVAPPPTTKMS